MYKFLVEIVFVVSCCFLILYNINNYSKNIFSVILFFVFVEVEEKCLEFLDKAFKLYCSGFSKEFNVLTKDCFIRGYVFFSF